MCIRDSSKREIERVLPGLNISNSLGHRIVTFWNGFTAQSITLQPGINRLVLLVTRLDLSPGEYKLSTTLGLDRETLDVVEDAANIHVLAPVGWSPTRYPTLDHGPLFPQFQWSKYE